MFSSNLITIYCFFFCLFIDCVVNCVKFFVNESEFNIAFSQINSAVDFVLLLCAFITFVISFSELSVMNWFINSVDCFFCSFDKI